jgi:hypothetical protein
MDVSQLVTLLLSLIPEKHRHAAVASIEALVLLQVTTSVVVSQLPASVANDQRYGKVLRWAHLFGHMRFRDEPGTLKLPGQAMAVEPERATQAPPPPSDPMGR